MTNDKIKNQIESFVNKYKANAGTFEGFRVIFDYVNFIKSELVIRKILGNVFDYAESQVQEVIKMAGDDKNLDELEKYDFSKMVFDIKDPLSLPFSPVFKKEDMLWREKMNKQDDFHPIDNLAIYLAVLIAINYAMTKVKESTKFNDIEKTNKLTQKIKDESLAFSVMNVKDNKGNLIKPVLNKSAIYLMAIQVVSKYILDEIDSREFISRDQPQVPISFDDDKSILNIRGEEIRIARQKKLGIEHFILKSIFSNKDISDSVDFSEISNHFLGEEYDKNKGWDKFRKACDRLNQKVDKATEGHYRGFIDYSTEKRGWCRINHKYL